MKKEKIFSKNLSEKVAKLGIIPKNILFFLKNLLIFIKLYSIIIVCVMSQKGKNAVSSIFI